MCKPRITFYLLWWTGPPGLGFYGSRLACLLSWLRMVNAVWLYSMRSEIFSQMELIIFQGCLIKQALFTLPARSMQSAPYSTTFPCSKVLYCIKYWSSSFEILNPFFSECSCYLLQHFFLVLVIFVSWYLRLKLSLELKFEGKSMRVLGLSKHLQSH